MPSKRASAPSWRSGRESKRFKPRERKTKVPRSIVPATINVRRTVFGGNWTLSTAATNGFWRYQVFDMSNFNNFAEFASIFDEYRVNAIKVTYRPSYDSITLPTTGSTAITQPQAYAHVCVDPSSTLIPSGAYGTSALQSLFENDGVKTFTLNRPFSIYYKPKVAEAVFNTGTASVMRSSPWVRTSETATVYRGYHMFLQANNFATTNANVSLDYYITMYVSFRNVR